MKRLFFSILGLLAACAVGSSLVPTAQAQQSNAPVQQSFSLRGVGQRIPTLTFSGPEATCAIVIYNSGGGFTLVPQVASDAQGNSTPSWVTATSVGGGSITSASTFVGSIIGSGTTAFGGILSALTSGTVTGVESCTAAGGGAVAIASIGPVTISSLPPVTIAAPTDAGGNVKVVMPAPSATQPVSGSVSVSSLPPITETIATATPPGAGYTVPSVLPVLAVTGCVQAPPTPAATGLATLVVGCAGATGGGSVLGTALCQILNAQNCVAVATPVDNKSSALAATTYSLGGVLNGASSNYDRVREAPSPAPSGIPASGYNTAGLAAPIICTKTAAGNGTTDANVQIIALSGTTHVYVCEADLSVDGSVAGNLRFLSGTGSACGTPVNQGPGVIFNTTDSATLSVGTGIGVIFDGGAGNELCIGGTGTSTLYVYHVMYEQF